MIYLKRLPNSHIDPSKTSFRSLLFALLGIFFAISSKGQELNICQQAADIVQSVKRFHVKPIEVDDAFSERVFSNFIDLIDPHGLYYSKVDYAFLEAMKNDIDEEMTDGNCHFLNQATELYKRKMGYTDSLLNTFRAQEFFFNNFDTLWLTESADYLTHNQAIDTWKKLIKYRVLYGLYANTDSAEVDAYPSSEKLIELKDIAISREICRIKSRSNYNGGIEAYVGDCFLKSVASAFDPHTSYFSESEEQVFVNHLSKQVYSFGLELTRNDFGEIEIEQMIAGSPSWNSSALHEGDVIMGVKSAETFISFDCVPFKEVMSFMSSEDIMEAEFSIRKKSGKEIQITLCKDEINVEDNVIQSFVLKGRDEIGYINLPSFYTQYNDEGYAYNGSASDVAKELIKLNKEDIKGLILDLRYNGGGSMSEAIQMAGIFVDYGAVGISKGRDEAPETLKDMNRGTIFNAPLIVLINRYSASASEFLAATLQDRNRAVIVGSASYGKSTIQRVVPIDIYKYDLAKTYQSKTKGYLKLTHGAFYRVTGKTHQKIGVIPDIQLPSIYDEVEQGEMYDPSALDLSAIEKKTYYYPLSSLPIDTLMKRHQVRMKNDTVFSEVVSISKRLADKQSNYAIPLNMELFKALYNSGDVIVMPEKRSVFSVDNPNYFAGFSSHLELNNRLNKNSITQIEKDIYIGEAFDVIMDLIQLNKK